MGAPERDGASDRTFVRMALAIGATSLLVFAWFVTMGRGDFAQTRTFADVFDLQARAIMSGRLSVPDGSLAFEGFVIDGQTYAYFGIFPSLLRIPVFLLTDRFDGELTQVSMLAAYAVALWSVARVVERTHRLMRPTEAWTRTGLGVAGLLLVVSGVGSNLLFLASSAWVYHEASLWGVAGVLASFAASLRFLERERLRTVVAAGLWAAVAWTSRGSVGLAPSVMLGLLGLARLTGHRWLSVLAPPPPPSTAGTWAKDRRTAAVLLVAAVAGAVVFGAVNTAKFGSPTALPIDKQVGSESPWPGRAAALEAYDGSLFSARLIPSVLVQTFRPDLVGLDRTWPFVGFRDAPPPTWGDVVFDTVDPSAGLTVTSPLLLVLTGVGCVAVLRRRRTRDGTEQPGPAVHRTSAATLRPFLLGGVAACYPPLTIAFIAQRYLTDALPLLLVASAVGVAVIDGWNPPHPARGVVGRRRMLTTGLGVLAVVGVFMTAAVTWSYQRFLYPPDREAMAAAVRTQVAVSRLVGSPPAVTRYEKLPIPAPGPGLAVVGDCLALYRGFADGRWETVEVSAAGGDHRLRVHLRGAGDDDPTAVLAVGDDADHFVVAVVVDGSEARFQLHRNGNVSPPGQAVDLGGGEHHIEVEADPTRAWVRVLVDERQVLFQPGGGPASTAATLGEDPFGALGRFPGTVVAEPTPTPTCDGLVDAAG